MRIWKLSLIIGWIGLALTPRASAQGFEAVGTRALGMAGAFVAVADDGTATYWNPAGLGTGAIFSLVVERQSFELGPRNPDMPHELQEGSSVLFALGTPPLGATYYRLRSTRLFSETNAERASTGRLVRASTLVTQHTGMSLVQSLGDALIVGTTLKYVHGRAGISTQKLTGENGLAEAAKLSGRGTNTFDLDLGAMASFGKVRAGVVVRNVLEPTFKTFDMDVKIPLQRQARVGLAVMPTSMLTISGDVDMTRTRGLGQDERHIAIGGEQWLWTRRVGLRGGFRVNTVDDTQPVGSAGLSIGLTSILWVDGFIQRGERSTDRAWGISGRVAF